MQRSIIADILAKAEESENRKLKICGWVRTVRSSKDFGFIEINDGSGQKGMQIVFEKAVIPNFDEVSRLGAGASIEAEGMLVRSPGSGQPFELKAETVDILGSCPPEYPLQKKRHSFEYLRTIAHLRPRTNTFSAVFRLRSKAAHAIHSFFNNEGFVYVHTPIITSNDCEGAGEMFRVTTLDAQNPPRDEKGEVDFTKDFFGRKTSLTVSGQLAVECYCMAFGKVYTFGPTFRAENSNTQRHASEFWMIEPEIAFATLKDDMELAEKMLKYVINCILTNAGEEIDFFNSFVDNGLRVRLEALVQSSFSRVTYTDAVRELKSRSSEFQYPVEWGRDLQTEHERYLTEKVFKGPVFVTDYPKDIKAFYMKQNDDGKTVAAMDLLVPGVGEIIGGSQREERYDVLAGRMSELGLCLDDYSWYLDLRKFGTVNHAGFGLGFERAIMYLTGMTNIRDVIPYPRTPKSAEF